VFKGARSAKDRVDRAEAYLDDCPNKRLNGFALSSTEFTTQASQVLKKPDGGKLRYNLHPRHST